MEETKEYSREDAKAFIYQKYVEQGDFPAIVDEKTLASFVDAILELDEAFIHESGADEDAAYDDDAAYEYLHAHMVARFDAYKTYMMRFVEDYLDYNEAYLDSLGLIDWE